MFYIGTFYPNVPTGTGNFKRFARLKHKTIKSDI